MRIVHNYDHTEDPLLRVRIKSFKDFMKTIEDIRSTMAYYRVYDSLFEVEPDEPSLTVTETGNTKKTSSF